MTGDTKIEWERIEMDPRVRTVFIEAERRMKQAYATPNPTLILGKLLEVEGFIETEKRRLREEDGFNNPNLDYWFNQADNHLSRLYRR
jgi:hypothetical protein